MSTSSCFDYVIVTNFCCVCGVLVLGAGRAGARGTSLVGAVDLHGGERVEGLGLLGFGG